MLLYNNNSTAPVIYKHLFKETFAEYKEHDWNFIYTDGSKTTNRVGFSVKDEHLSTKVIGVLCKNNTIFEAETTAILEALNHIKIPTKKLLYVLTVGLFSKPLKTVNSP